MTTRVTSAPEKAPATAANTRPSTPAAAAPKGKTFNHVLGQARTHAAKASPKTATKQSTTGKTTAVKGQQSPAKSSGPKGKSTSNGVATNGRGLVKKQVTTDPSTKARVGDEQDNPVEGEEAEHAPVVKDQEPQAKDQQAQEKKGGSDQRQPPDEKAKQDQSQTDTSAVQVQMQVNPVQAAASASAVKSNNAGSSSPVAKVSDLNATPRAQKGAIDAPAMAASGKTPTGVAATGMDAAGAPSDAGDGDDSTAALEAPITAAHAAPVVAGKTDESSPVNPAIGNGQEVKSVVAHAATAAAVAAPRATEYQFADANHGNIVSGIHGQLFPNGGTMQIRLDPPELGPLHITVKIENGVLSATFQTSNDQASKLLSHSLVDLKQTLEGQGMTINRLHVEQSGKPEVSNGKSGEDSSSRDESHGQGEAQGRGSEQDQQRREMLQRMWRRIAGGGDPLDLVA